jgi:hypothetical protein
LHVAGETLHSLLRLPVDRATGQQDGAGQALAGGSMALLELQGRFRAIRSVFVAERAMTGCAMLAAVRRRLQQAGMADEPLGGVSVVLMGDDAQLHPVADKPFGPRLVDAHGGLLGRRGSGRAGERARPRPAGASHRPCRPRAPGRGSGRRHRAP